ncbi:hypothetical protein EDB84DRAFT_1519511 [Lactarius hengduanensis]|nr:hypothetical protein EDB84DRAFT_1519511 [Lactarius hengduanensis]
MCCSLLVRFYGCGLLVVGALLSGLKKHPPSHDTPISRFHADTLITCREVDFVSPVNRVIPTSTRQPLSCKRTHSVHLHGRSFFSLTLNRSNSSNFPVMGSSLHRNVLATYLAVVSKSDQAFAPTHPWHALNLLPFHQSGIRPALELLMTSREPEPLTLVHLVF